jgi:hypothetical protein
MEKGTNQGGCSEILLPEGEGLRGEGFFNTLMDRLYTT